MQKLAIGIDIGGTNTSIGLVNRRGEIIAYNKIKTTGEATIGGYIESIRTALLPIIEEAGRQEIAGIGVGAPNANFYTGEIANAANLPWKGTIPLARLLTESLGFKTTLTNDANAAAIGEMTYGAAIGMKDFVMVTLGTGVGSGFVANGSLIYGHDGNAGELGHIIAIRDGRECGCGRKGCLETYASATGIVRTAKAWLSERKDSTLLRQNEPDITARIIQEAAQAGDAFALELFEYTGKILGRSLADVVALTSPQAFIFFGGLSQAGKLILAPAQRSIEEHLLFVYRNKITFLQSALPDADAAILGASALAW
jgi:glucokinase